MGVSFTDGSSLEDHAPKGKLTITYPASPKSDTKPGGSGLQSIAQLDPENPSPGVRSVVGSGVQSSQVKKKDPLTNLKPYQKGQSGNAGGQPKWVKEVKDALKDGSLEAADYLKKVVRGGVAGAKVTDRNFAAKTILEFTVPKPKQTLQLQSTRSPLANLQTNLLVAIAMGKNPGEIQVTASQETKPGDVLVCKHPDAQGILEVGATYQVLHSKKNQQGIEEVQLIAGDVHLPGFFTKAIHFE